MTFVRNAVIGALAVGAASMVACTTGTQDVSPSTSNSSNGSSGATGSLGFELDLGSGISVDTVSYSISNPTLPGFSTITSTFDTSGNPTVSFSVTLPVGSGYTLSLSATDSAGDPCIAGPVTFAVVAGQSNAVALTLVCLQTIDGGNIGPDVNVGTVTVSADASLQTTTFGGSCAAATVLSAALSSEPVGSSISLVGEGIDPNFQSGDVSLAWSATGGAGTLSSTSGSSNSFTCVSPGVETITLTASIASTGASCAGVGSLSVQITCTGTGTGTGDAGEAADTGSVVDAGTGPLDSGAVDSGADTSTGEPDASGGGVDSGSVDSSTVDAGGGEVDAAVDSGGGGGAPTACTSAPCAASGANSVQCVNSATSDGVCTPTEALIVTRDIANGNIDATGQLKPFVSATNSGSCYTCLNAKACLDDNQQDVGNECADTPDLSGAAAGSGVAQCLTTLSCILGSDCQGAGGVTGTSATSSQENVQLCYCGGNNAGSACSTAGTATNGLCVTQEAAGFGFAFSDNKDILANYGSQLFPSGSANAIFQCGASNKCSLCE
jgi:hypothetical protein